MLLSPLGLCAGTTTKTAMEIAAQQESRGILYEGYTKAFKQCIFEDGDIMGRNERYEFRCDEDMECCGRACCIPGAATVPLWLVILFIILGLLALAALLALLAYLCSKRKKTPKIKKEKFVPSPLVETLIEKPQPVKIVQHNEDEISRASVPEAVELSPPPTQKAQHAFYRPFVPDVVDEHVIAPPDRGQVGVHDISEITTPQYPSYSTLERPKERKAEKMYTRPGFDNVPSY